MLLGARIVRSNGRYAPCNPVSTMWVLCPRGTFSGVVPVLRQGLLIFYCAAVGFVASGVAASLYKMITLESARFKLLGDGWFGTVATFFFCAVTGPAIVMDLVIRNRLVDKNAVGALVAGLFVAVLWSVCSGVVVLGVVLQFRDLA
jgi:hypothetical protein